jgi:hypothetical protein
MNKIPLETTLAGSYRFLFTRILSILGTLWLPVLVTAALTAGIVWLVVPHEWLAGNFPKLGEHPAPQEIWAICMPFVAGFPLLFVTMLVMSSMMYVGLMRLSLGQTPRCFAFFSLGGDVWRMALAFVAIWLLIMLLEAGLVGLFVAALFAAKALMPETAMVLFLIVLGIAELCFFVYVAVRWSFFIPAVVVAEHSVGLGRSWELGGGNFWRIVVISLLIYIPVAMVAGMVWQMALMPYVVSEAMRLPENPGTAEIDTFFRALMPLLPVGLTVMVLQQVATMGLVAGAIGTAYKALNPAVEEEKTPA